MTKAWRVALHEYTRHVFNRRFLLALLSVPFLVTVMIGLIFLVIFMETNTRPIGYVDQSGLLADPILAPASSGANHPITFLTFGDEAAAQAAMESGKIQAFYVLPADYAATGRLKVVHIDTLKSPATSKFYRFLAANLVKGMSPAIARRLVESSEVIVQSADGSRRISAQNWFSVLLPLIAGVAFVIAMFSTCGYLMGAVVEEKENRTMEVIITSVSPNQFMAGKIVADIAIGLTQILVWGVFIAVVLLVSNRSLGLLEGFQISLQTVLLVLIVLFPGFIMFAALMGMIGATVAEARDGQQVMGLISLPLWLPYMLTGLIIGNPNAPAVVALSMFPLTAPLTMLVRDGTAVIPAWQIAATSTIMFLSAFGAVWMAGRAFRLGMLRYGKRLAWREIFARQGVKP
jgi:ABC-2 type transport system permease protein